MRSIARCRSDARRAMLRRIPQDLTPDARVLVLGTIDETLDVLIGMLPRPEPEPEPEPEPPSD